MSFYLSFGSFRIPAYGCFIVLGVVTANLIALHPLKRYRLDGNDFLITEAYLFLGAFLGAKLLYLAVHFSSIDWSQLTDFSYLNQVMQGGFVFYGGLAGGLALLLVPLKLHHIDIFLYTRVTYILTFYQIWSFIKNLNNYRFYFSNSLDSCLGQNRMPFGRLLLWKTLAGSYGGYLSGCFSGTLRGSFISGTADRGCWFTDNCRGSFLVGYKKRIPTYSG